MNLKEACAHYLQGADIEYEVTGAGEHGQLQWMHSGTNDKAGSILNLLRWTSPRVIKETFVPPTRYEYPHIAQQQTILHSPPHHTQ